VLLLGLGGEANGSRGALHEHIPVEETLQVTVLHVAQSTVKLPWAVCTATDVAEASTVTKTPAGTMLRGAAPALGMRVGWSG